MKAILLCAGYATRLYPLTENQPKPLLPIAGRPILEYLLEKLERVPSIFQLFLVTNERFFRRFRDWVAPKKYPWKIEVVNDRTQTNETRLGAVGDLVFTLRKFGIRDDVAVFAGDNLFHTDLTGFFSFAAAHRPHASLGVVDIGKRERASQYGVVRVGEDQRIVEFLEKPKEPPSTLVSTGVYWFPKEGLGLLDRYLREGHNADRPGDYIRWLVEVDQVYAHPFEGGWFDIGDLDSYKEADRHFQEMIANQSNRRGGS